VIRNATPADAPELYRICLLTGDAGRDATALHSDPDLLGEVYVGPYLHVPPAVAGVALDEGGLVLGYVLGTPDTPAFAAACEAAWWPALRSRHPMDPGDAGRVRLPADQALVQTLHRPPTPEAGLVAEYSAHLHIDLLPEAQGRGLGRALIDWVLSQLAELGAEGVHLGVDPRNTAAIAFYERLGFIRWGSDPDAVTLVRPLA
jgi:ribosomal protein S18 acetylase RimI-like enzyme